MTLAHGSTARVEPLAPDAGAAPPGMPGQCANCETPLAGAYCHACGQSASVHGADMSVRRFLATAVHEVSDVDSVLLRTFRTLVLRPGQLTLDYLAGRRARHYSPLKLYLLVSAVYLLVAWEPYNDMQGMSEDLRANPTFEQLRGPGHVDDGPFVDQWIARTGEYMAYARFLSVAGFALLVGWLFRRPKRPYAAHLVFALHYYAFDFLLYSVLIVPVVLARWLTGAWPPESLVYALLPLHVWYAYASALRVYGQSRARTALRATGLLVGDIVLTSLGTIIALGAARASIP